MLKGHTAHQWEKCNSSRCGCPTPHKSTLSPCFCPIPLTCFCPIPLTGPNTHPLFSTLYTLLTLSSPDLLPLNSSLPRLSLPSSFCTLTVFWVPVLDSVCVTPANCLPCVHLWGSSGHRWQLQSLFLAQAPCQMGSICFPTASSQPPYVLQVRRLRLGEGS